MGTRVLRRIAHHTHTHTHHSQFESEKRWAESIKKTPNLLLTPAATFVAGAGGCGGKIAVEVAVARARVSGNLLVVEGTVAPLDQPFCGCAEIPSDRGGGDLNTLVFKNLLAGGGALIDAIAEVESRAVAGYAAVVGGGGEAPPAKRARVAPLPRRDGAPSGAPSRTA